MVIDDVAAADVDEIAMRRQQGECLRIEQAGRLGSRRQRRDQVVDVAQESLQVCRRKDLGEAIDCFA